MGQRAGRKPVLDITGTVAAITASPRGVTTSNTPVRTPVLIAPAGSTRRGEVPAGAVRCVPHLHARGEEAVPHQVGQAVVTGLPGAAAQLEERLDVRSDDVPRVPDADTGEVAEPHDQAAQD